MTPRELASRIAALDWSGTSLQHQLAVTAAVETIRAIEPPRLAVVSSSIRTVRLLHMDGRQWCTAGFIGPESAWSWIVETVAHELSCNEDDVHCAESDEGDVVTVNGEPCYRVAHGYPRN
jgi:hypothetical protein